MTQIKSPPQTEQPRVDRTRYWRLADLAQFPNENGFRYEIIHGSNGRNCCPNSDLMSTCYLPACHREGGCKDEVYSEP